MKYVIIGAGGTGGTIGAYMTKAGKDAVLIARGAHLRAIRENGLKLEKLWNRTEEVIKAKACSMEEYQDSPDVIFVCVKGYSLEGTIPFIRRIAHKNTIIIPILNIYGTGGRLQKHFPDLSVMDGCIYVSANIKEPGVILQHGEILRIVFGPRTPQEFRPVLEDIERELNECGIRGILSENIQRDALQKFAYVSPIGAAGLYCNAAAGQFQQPGKPREMFKAMTREIIALAEAMNIHFEKDLVQLNLDILADLPPETTTSMQRDVMEGKESEMDGLIFEVVRLGQKYGVDVPEYQRAAQKYGFKG